MICGIYLEISEMDFFQIVKYIQNPMDCISVNDNNLNHSRGKMSLVKKE